MLKQLLCSKRAIIFVVAFILLISPLSSLAAELPIPSDDPAAFDYQLVSLNRPPSVMERGEKGQLTVKMLNTGIGSWYRDIDPGEGIMLMLAVSHPKYRTSAFGFKRVAMVESQVDPGQTATFIVNLKAPKRGGIYREYLQPVAVGSFWLKDRGICFKTEVLGRASKVRVGITYAGSQDNPRKQIVIGADGKYCVKSPSGRVLKTCLASQVCQVKYRQGIYYLYCQGKLFRKTLSYPVFVPLGDSILRIASYRQRGFSFSGNRRFRGNLVVRYSDYADALYPKALFAINEVDIEDYLKGLAEEPEGIAFSALRTTAIVARTYALRNLAHPKKSCLRRGFHLFNNTWSQVYKGYEYELRAPRLRRAVMKTHGLVITYRGKPIVAAYSSRCGGKTKTLSSFPYLKSKRCACHGHLSCAGSRLGHGSGMCMAGMRRKARAGWSPSRIIHYYYQGVAIRDLY